MGKIQIDLGQEGRGRVGKMTYLSNSFLDSFISFASGNYLTKEPLCFCSFSLSVTVFDSIEQIGLLVVSVHQAPNEDDATAPKILQIW